VHVTVHERSIGDITIMDVDGRITVQEGATVFRQTISRLLNGARPQIVVNMAVVSYIDSTALGELVRGYTSAAKRGGVLKLLHVPPPVQQLLTMTRLADVFEIFPNEADAVKSFGPGGDRNTRAPIK
jgi:anti-anti-sigma factor